MIKKIFHQLVIFFNFEKKFFAGIKISSGNFSRRISLNLAKFIFLKLNIKYKKIHLIIKNKYLIKLNINNFCKNSKGNEFFF